MRPRESMQTAPIPFKTVAQTLRSLPDDDEERVHRDFRARGGSSSRWAKKDWTAMADALTAFEDREELRSGPKHDVSTIRSIRRSLEEAVS